MKGLLTSRVAPDGSTLSCIAPDGSVKWVRQAPSEEEWLRLYPRLLGKPGLGCFRYAGDEYDGRIHALFTPLGADGFNLVYDAHTGALISIHAAPWG